MSATSFNCSVLSDTFDNLDNFLVNVYNNEFNNGIYVKLSGILYAFNDKFKVDHLKDYVCARQKVVDSDICAVKLWKVNIKIDKKSISKELLKDEMMPLKLFCKYFKADEIYDPERIHIIAIIPTSTGKCLPTFYLSNKKFAVTKYRVWSDLFFSVSYSLTYSCAFLSCFLSSNPPKKHVRDIFFIQLGKRKAEDSNEELDNKKVKQIGG